MEGRGTSIFGRSTFLAAGAAGALASTTGAGGASTSGSGRASNSGREGAAKGNSLRGSQLTTCMADR
ncbi:hypothetical protein BME99_26660 [Pseudomonas protegens]|nr:hypothetical protein BME99_26660 [Pseudomonas protegens]